MGKDAVELSNYLNHFDETIIGFYGGLEGITLSSQEAFKQQLQNFALLFRKKSSYAEQHKETSVELKKIFGEDGFLNFVNELLLKSVGYYYDYNKKQKGIREGKFEKITPKEQPPILPDKISVFDLLLIAESYLPPKTKFINSKSGDLTFSASFVENALIQVFNVLFNQSKAYEDGKEKDMPVCTKNKEPNSLAEYSDAADPFTHCLRVRTSRKDSFVSVLEATIIKCIGCREGEKKSKEFLLVDGVYGNLEILNEQEEKVIDYLYECLIAYAYSERTGLLFNPNFNTKFQQEPIIVTNQLARKICGREIYKRTSESRCHQPTFDIKNLSGCFKYTLKAITLTEKSKLAKKVKAKLVHALEPVFHKPEEVLKYFTDQLRYAEAWAYALRKKQQKYPQWNKREGNAYCLTIDYETVKDEYHRIFGNSLDELRKAQKQAWIAAMISCAFISLSIPTVLYFSGAFNEKNEPKSNTPNVPLKTNFYSNRDEFYERTIPSEKKPPPSIKSLDSAINDCLSTECGGSFKDRVIYCPERIKQDCTTVSGYKSEGQILKCKDLVKKGVKIHISKVQKAISYPEEAMMVIRTSSLEDIEVDTSTLEGAAVCAKEINKIIQH